MQQHLTIMDDNIPLAAVLERPGAVPCPLVIVLHGFGSSKDRPHTLAACAAMRDKGFATLRFDLYGHGESGGTFRDHTLYKWIGNALAVLDYARSLPEITEIYFSGHSQGELTAALAASMAPDLVKGLILRAPAFLIPRCAREGSMLGYHIDPQRIPDEVEAFNGQTLGADYFRVAQTIHAEDAIDRYPGPVLLLQGDQDDLVPPEDSRQAAERYRHCRLVMLSGESHHFDRCTEQMCAAIREWLEDLH